MTVVLCNGSQELNTTNSSFVMYSPLFRRLMPFLLTASAAFVLVFCLALLLQLKSHFSSQSKRTSISDVYLFLLATVGLMSSIFIGASAITALVTAPESNFPASKNYDSSATPRASVSAFVSFRLVTIVVVYTFVLVKRFSSAKFSSQLEHAFSRPDQPLNGENVHRSFVCKRCLMVFGYALVPFVLFGGAIALDFVAGGDNQFSCFFIIGKWQRYVVICLSYPSIGLGAVLLLYIFNARRKPPGSILPAVRGKKWMDVDFFEIHSNMHQVDFFNSEWKLNRMFLTVVMTSYVTWIPLLVVLTVYDDQDAVTHETIEIIAIVFACLGYLAEPLLYATTPRYAQLYKEILSSIFRPVKTFFVLTFAPYDHFSRQRLLEPDSDTFNRDYQTQTATRQKAATGSDEQSSQTSSAFIGKRGTAGRDSLTSSGESDEDVSHPLKNRGVPVTLLSENDRMEADKNREWSINDVSLIEAEEAETGKESFVRNASANQKIASITADCATDLHPKIRKTSGDSGHSPQNSREGSMVGVATSARDDYSIDSDECSPPKRKDSNLDGQPV
ncbi:uncharacterized protein [Oscarella lobularis]|uniref:uncharacterized protein isoform X2 n=1 Tax=Oscarella lobularis TaxID=121494 RepID=UPI00331373C5